MTFSSIHPSSGKTVKTQSVFFRWSPRSNISFDATIYQEPSSQIHEPLVEAVLATK